MATPEKTATQPSPAASITPNGGTNSVVLGPHDTLNGRLDIQGDLKIQGKVEGELKVSGDLSVEASANVQASIEAANVSVRGQVSGPVTARRRLLLAGSGKLNGDVKVGRLTVEDGATLNGNVSMQPSGDKS